MLLVPLTGVALRTGNGLTFPVDQLPADRVVPISRGGREVSTCFVESECQQVHRCVRKPAHAFPPLRHFQPIPFAESGKNLPPCVSGMDIQGHFGVR